MIRISDIVKMNDADVPEEKKEPLVRESRKDDIPEITKRAEEGKMEDARLYKRGTVLIDEVLGRIKKEEKMYSEPIVDFARSLVDATLVNDNAMFPDFYDTEPSDHYLPLHSMNVSLLSAKIGIWLGLNKSDLMELTLAGFLHDIGMAKMERIAGRRGKLGAWDMKKVRRHPQIGMECAKAMRCLNDDGLTAIGKHHRRGPRDKFTQIIGLADIYEAITHPRPYKEAKAPHHAVGEIIDREALSFQPDVIKSFVNNIGIYPIGSWVRLSTKEIGVVIATNKAYPLRPKVSVMFDHSGQRLKEPKAIDFTEESHFYIDGPMDITDKEKLRTEEVWEGQK